MAKLLRCYSTTQCDDISHLIGELFELIKTESVGRIKKQNGVAVCPTAEWDVDATRRRKVNKVQFLGSLSDENLQNFRSNIAKKKSTQNRKKKPAKTNKLTNNNQKQMQ